jgi:hypothetical protein
MLCSNDPANSRDRLTVDYRDKVAADACFPAVFAGVDECFFGRNG